MENNFFVGVVHHSKRNGKIFYETKAVLFTDDNKQYTNLDDGKVYPLGKDVGYIGNYVKEETLIFTDPSDYKTDYEYLSLKYSTSDVPEPKTSLIKKLIDKDNRFFN